MSIKKIIAGFSVAAIALMMVPDAWAGSTVRDGEYQLRYAAGHQQDRETHQTSGTVSAGVVDNTYTTCPAERDQRSGAGAEAPILFGSTQAGQHHPDQRFEVLTRFEYPARPRHLRPSARVTLATATCKYGAGAAGSCVIPDGCCSTAAGTVSARRRGCAAVATQARASTYACSAHVPLTIVYYL